MIINDLFHSKKTTLAEFAPGSGGDDDHQDPYGAPKPEHYDRSIDFFGQFEADHFDEEDMNDATGEFKGYWYYDGKPRQIAYFKFDNPRRTGSNHPGVGWYYEPQNEDVAEGPNDGREDNFTIDDIKRLEKIRDLETLKAQAKELIKGKPARRMKPEKISWFYNHIDTLKNPLAVIKMMYDLMLAGEGNKVIGSRNSMASNSYRTRFGEQDMAEDNSVVPVHRIGLTVIDPNHPMVSKRGEQYQKSVRVPGEDREKAINSAIAHLRKKGYKVLDHHYLGTVEPVNELDKNTVKNWIRRQPERIKGNAGLSRTDFKKAKRLVDKSIPSAMAKYKDPNYGQQEPRLNEVSLGDYRKKAMLNKAMSQTDRFFGRDDPTTVASADRTIAKRERGLARADARIKPYTPPQHDAEKYQSELTAKYPNIDELVADAERNRDPYYDRAEGEAYYRGREAEHNYQRLKQIQRVIQGLNESLQQLDEFNPFSKKKATTPDSTAEPPAAASGIKFDLMGRPYKPAPVAPNYDKSSDGDSNIKMNAPKAAVPSTQSMMPTNMIPKSAAPTATPTLAAPSAVPNTAMTTTSVPKFNDGGQVRLSAAPAPELQTIDAPPQLTGPAAAKQLGMNDPNVVDVVARPKTKTSTQQAALPAPAAPVSNDYSKSLSGYGKTTTNTPASFPSGASNMMPTNMIPTAAKTAPKPAVSTTAAKNEILQALKKLGYKSKEAEAAIRGLPPNISTSDAIRQILRGKPTTTTESLSWSRNFNPARSLYRRMKQDH